MRCRTGPQRMRQSRGSGFWSTSRTVGGQTDPSQPFHHLHDQQRVPTELEEIVASADTLHSQQLCQIPARTSSTLIFRRSYSRLT